MKRFSQILLLSWWAWLTPLAAQNTNILDAYNGDFESGLALWRFFEVPTSLGSTATVITTGVAHGSKAVKVTYVSATPSLVDRGLDNWETNVPVVGSQGYTASVQARTDTPGSLQLRITLGFFDPNRVVLDQISQDFLLTDAYQTFSIQRNAPAEAQYCWIAFRLKEGTVQHGAGTLYLDNAQLVGAGAPPPPALVPRVMATTLESEDVPIASINVTEPPYGARNDGSSDVTNVFQQAIDNAAAKGGGVVFVPSGTYRFDGSMTSKEKVTLRGEWLSPDNGGNGKGTILAVHGGRGSETGTPFISINRGSGIRNLTIQYPQQAIPAEPYPWTILCNPDNAAGRGDNTSVINVTLVNPYQAIKIGPASNELHYIRNVYGSPLKTGIWLSQTTDIGRIINVHFEPKYWSSSTFTGSPAEAAVKSWTQSIAEGIVMGRSDWEYMYDVSLIGYKTGVRIFRYDPSGPAANGVIYGLHTEDGEVGIKFEVANPYGFAITGSTINVSAGNNPVCVLATNSFTTVAQFNTCSFGGNPKTAILFEDNSTARLTFQNCTFTDWGSAADDAAIKVQKGSVAVLGSDFKQDKLHVHLGMDVPNAQILDNAVPSKLNITNLSNGEVAITQEGLEMPKLDIPSYPYASERRPASNALFVVTDYGAVGDKVTDDTQAFQAALNAAGQAGGGTVYAPAGWYKIAGHLNVPSGVELRGIWDVPHHTTSQGTVLLAMEGIGNPTGTPFIALQQNSGVRGLTVWYPDQNYSAFPWTVQVQGADCWVKDVTLANSYQGIDLASYPSLNHFISYVGGSPLKTGIHVSHNSGEGWVENVQFNPHYWKRSGGYPKNANPDLNGLTPYQQANLDALKFGSCFNEHQLGNFVYAAKRGLYFANDGGSCKSDVFLHGTDAGSYGISVESPAGSQLTFVNSQLVLTAAASLSYIHVGAAFGGKAMFVNTLEWGNQSGLSADINGSGTVTLQQVNTSADRFNIAGGSVSIHGITMSNPITPQYTIGSGVTACSLFGNFNPSEFQMTAADGSAVEADYNFQHIKRSFSFYSGWELTEPQSQWINTLFLNENIASLNGQGRPQCLSVGLGDGRALLVSGKDNSTTSSVVYFKVFKTRIPVYSSTALSYSFRPQDNLGRGVHVELLFADGSRLTELHPVAMDSMLLTALRGTPNQWNRLVCAVGKYAVGKTIQEILVGYDHPEDVGPFSAYIDSLAITVLANVPSPWTAIDIGGAKPAGATIVENGVFSLLGGGNGLRYGGDSFYFVSQQQRSDFAITAKLENVTQGSGISVAGIMVRESQLATAKFAMLGLYPQSGLQTLYRLTSVSSIQSITHDAYGRKAPRWLRIVRSNSVFTMLTSSDGITWLDTLSRVTVAMDSTVMVGMTLGAGTTDETTDARFSSVSIMPSWTTGVSGPATGFLPSEYRLDQNCPNPFNPSTSISFEIPKEGFVELSIYNIQGQKVASLLHGEQRAGRYRVQWNGTNDAGVHVSSGLYLCRMNAGNRQFANKMLLLR